MTEPKKELSQAEKTILAVAEAIKAGKKILYRTYRIGAGDGMADIRFLSSELEFIIEEPTTGERIVR